MQIITKTDFWLGLVILAGGIWAYAQSLGFDDASRDYPLFLSAVTAFFGAGIAGQTLRQARAQGRETAGKGSLADLFNRTRGSLLIMGLFILWTLLLSTETGYLLSTALILLPVLWLLGIRKAGQFALITAGIIAAVFTLFFIIFEVPLPLNPYVQSFFDLLN